MSAAKEIIEFVADNCPNIRRLQKQLDEKQVSSLLEKYTKEQVIDQLMKMENYKPLPSRYTSVYLTCMKWFVLDEEKGYLKQKTALSSPKVPQMSEKDIFLLKHPVGSEYTSKAGIKYKIEDTTFARNIAEDSVIPINYLLINRRASK